jgi:peroxiredoxin
MELILFGMLLPWLLLGFGSWLGYQLLRQNGRILVRLEQLEEILKQQSAAAPPAGTTAPPEGLLVGSPAPDFELPDLDGAPQTLAALRGKKVLLTFFNAGCGFCEQLAPELAKLPADGSEGRPVPVVVAAGDPAANRKLVTAHGINCPVLLQPSNAVAEQYQAGGTPMGYLIDEQGQIAAPLAIGARALLALAGSKPSAVGTRDLSRSKLLRDGLPAGTPAPEFTLPRCGDPDGGELSLTQFRGRKLLLVFSDPHCGPCDLLLPELERCYRENGELAVVLIGRGEAEENRRKVRQHRLTFPIVLQKQWEISRRYAMFATPIAYLIDEQGKIAREVAIGPEPILVLARDTATELTGRCGVGGEGIAAGR